MSIAADLWDVDRGPVGLLLAYTFGILAYALVVNGFYQVLSHRVMLGRLVGRQRQSTAMRTLLYLVMFPLLSFAFFLLLASALLFMASGAKGPTLIFTIAMAVVLAVRVAAYVSQPASHDLAKLLPLGLLGVFLVTGEVSSLRESVAELQAIPENLDTIGTFFVIVVATEYLLRAYHAILHAVLGRKGQGPDLPEDATVRSP